RRGLAPEQFHDEPRQIANVNEVPRLQPVAKDAARPFKNQALSKDADDARVGTAWILTLAVDIEEPATRAGDGVQLGINPNRVFAAQLIQTVRCGRPREVVFRSRARKCLGIYGRRTGIDQALVSAPSHAFEQSQSGCVIDRMGAQRILYRDLNRGLRGKVDDRVATRDSRIQSANVSNVFSDQFMPDPFEIV